MFENIGKGGTEHGPRAMRSKTGSEAGRPPRKKLDRRPWKSAQGCSNMGKTIGEEWKHEKEKRRERRGKEQRMRTHDSGYDWGRWALRKSWNWKKRNKGWRPGLSTRRGSLDGAAALCFAILVKEEVG